MSLGTAQAQTDPNSTAGDTLRANGWLYHDLGPKTRCLNGGTTSAANAAGNASVLYRPAPPGGVTDQILLFMEGGGNCHNYDTCNGISNQNTKPKHADGYSRDAFLIDAKLRDNLYLRTGQGSPPNDGPPADGSTTLNPFRNMTMIMIPYCTGDAHSGETTLMETVGSSTQYMNFYGHINFKRAVAFLKASGMFNGVKTIWLMGSSAGGAGATKQFSYLRKKFFGSSQGSKQVNLIEDSSPVIPPVAGSPDYIGIWQAYLPGCDSASATEAYLSSEPTDVLPPPSYAQNMAVQVSCATIQETRLYNRGLDSSFLYGFMSFKWDGVLNPYGSSIGNPNNGYPLFFTRMSQGISEPGPLGDNSLEGQYGTGKSKHLYVDNILPRDISNKICPGHVVTNFGVQGSGFAPGRRLAIENAHSEFIANMMVAPTTLWSSSMLVLGGTECPASTAN